MKNASADKVIVWFRRDLRLSDNPALHFAAQKGEIVPVYILEEPSKTWEPGGASRWWLHHSLEVLQKSFAKHGVALILRQGDPEKILRDIARKTNATAVYWNRRYEPHHIEADKAIKESLKVDDFDVQSFNGRLLCEPWDIKNGSGNPYKVFTPFWKACSARLHDRLKDIFPVPTLKKSSDKIPNDSLEDWKLLPTKPDWAGGMRQFWKPGEANAQKLFSEFLDGPVAHYKTARDYPGIDATSKLSPHLHFGEISPKQLVHAVRHAIQRGDLSAGAIQQAEHFLTEIGWREFAYHLLVHYPHTPTKPLNEKFENFPWRYNKKDLRAWQKGQTGYPLVDAGMRQLWQTGWMHNRVRMIVGSFLVKHLLLPWQQGAEWFWDTLVDADLASNTLGWQWVSGCGADAAPYFRIFNPILQSEKFDGNGDYIRHYVPELKKLPDQYLHAPWDAPKEILQQAGIVLGKDYPKPIVDHPVARVRALEALKKTK